MNNNKDDIKFLEEFRLDIDKYLFLGFAPAYGSPGGDEAVSIVEKKLKDIDYANLRKKIAETRPRAIKIVSKLGLSCIYVQYPPANLHGRAPVIEQHFFNLVTENRAWQRINKETILDLIDGAIGVLKAGVDMKKENSSEKETNKVSPITDQQIKQMTISQILQNLSIGAIILLSGFVVGYSVIIYKIGYYFGTNGNKMEIHQESGDGLTLDQKIFLKEIYNYQTTNKLDKVVITRDGFIFDETKKVNTDLNVGKIIFGQDFSEKKFISLITSISPLCLTNLLEERWNGAFSVSVTDDFISLYKQNKL